MRSREDIEKSLNESNSEEYTVFITAEILLDIREHLGKLVMHQGVAKWGAKIGPSAVTSLPKSPGQQIDDGVISGPDR